MFRAAGNGGAGMEKLRKMLVLNGPETELGGDKCCASWPTLRSTGNIEN